VHLVDVHPLPGQQRPSEAYQTIRNELQKYSQALADKPEIIVANKIDLAPTLEAVDELSRELGQEVLAISGVTGAGLEPLGERLWSMILEARAAAPPPIPVNEDLYGDVTAARIAGLNLESTRDLS
jgi:GTP-binding protein